MIRKALDNILDRMTEVVEESKEEIFYISEQTNKEYVKLQEDLDVTKKLVHEYIERSDRLAKQVRHSRKKLSIVSQKFESYSEDEVRKVYEETHQLQTELIVVEQEEKSLRDKRDDLERRILNLKETMERSQKLGRKVSIISSFLQDDFHQVNKYIKSAREKEEIGLKIIEAQELERKRISREIHDGPAQSLANILVRSEIVDLSFRDGDLEQAFEEMRSIRENIRQSLHEVRRIIYDLRPMALDDLGLFPTIKKHISTMSQYNDIQIKMSLEGKGYELKSNYEVAIFRLIQESLQNAINHSGAENIHVTLKVTEEKAEIVVADDGKGFNVDVIEDESYGIIGMRERVEYLNGEINIHSEISQGTTVQITLPLQEYFNEQRFE